MNLRRRDGWPLPVVTAFLVQTSFGCSRASQAPPATDTDTLRGVPDQKRAAFVTVYKSPLVIEGLTGDAEGNLYAPGRAQAPEPCPVWRVALANGQKTLVGNLPGPCSPAGLAFNRGGDLFVADGDKIYQLRPSAEAPPTATVFAAGVPGANGVAFDRRGNLWVSDGVTAQGRVWRVAPDGKLAEVLRVQPVVNDVNVVDGGGGVGRDPRFAPPATVTFTPGGRAASNTAGSQHIVANGLAFSEDGSLLVADTARGAIWKVELDEQGKVKSPVGCDTTFSPNTLCLTNVFAAHPLLEGADGIALDTAGNIWVAANERNAVVVVTPHGHVREIFRNPPDGTTRLRNGGPLEFPTSPFLVDRKFCTTQSDLGRRDNAPNSGGEAGPSGPALAKVSCLDQPLPHPGLPLPVR